MGVKLHIVQYNGTCTCTICLRTKNTVQKHPEWSVSFVITLPNNLATVKSW